jgi:uncharacterized RDD family membrane protein YckC
MKCPKCGYLGYERVERCRNCGYEFSLTSTPPSDLKLRDAERVPQPLDDLELIDAATPRPGAGRFTDLGAEPGDASGAGQLTELPLFGAPIADDVPLITKPSAPRPPLSVRRATPEVPRLRSEPRAPLLDWPEPQASTTPVQNTASRPAPDRPRARPQEPLHVEPDTFTLEPAALGARALAALIDVGLLLAVDVIVVYFTLQICRVSFAELALLPKAPLLAFLLLQNVGYVVAFTTTGQTLGKMIAGVRVLADDTDNAPDIGQSVLRALVWMVLALPAGLGLLTATLSRDGRGLHDRFAGTRVVRAGA